MIAGIFHEGSGLGNQLHRYVMTRCLALDKQYEFGMINPENFKGKHFMDLDMGKPVNGLKNSFLEHKTEHLGWDVRDMDMGIYEVKDNTGIDGEFQDERYFQTHLHDIRQWLWTEPVEFDKDACVINFRGGEYVGVESLFLPQTYWDEAIRQMGDKKYEVHTDDPETAEKFFPDFPIISNMELNWRSIRYAPNLILSNSSFAILPALMGNAEKIIAPTFWAGYNKGFWQLKQNHYARFTYI